MEKNLGAQQRSLGDRQLRMILPIGLGCSVLFHTAAIAGITYLAQNQADENLDVVTIERVTLDPEPKPTPTPTPPVIKATPKPKEVKVAKPLPQPKPPEVKITKTPPKIEPKVVKVAQPKPIPSAVPVVKIAKSSAPAPDPVAPTPFPDFPIEQPQPQKVAPKAVVKQPQKTVRKTAPDPTPVDPNQTALATQPRRSGVVSPPDLNDRSEPDDDPTPTIPATTPKLAKSTDPTPTTTNQTNIATTNRSTRSFDSYDPTATNPTPEADFDTGVPGNSKRIATNNDVAPASSNQSGLSARRNQGKGSMSFDAASNNDNTATTDDITGGAPGNNKRIASSTSGSNGAVSAANSTGLGSKNRGNGSSIAKNFGSGGTGDGGIGGDDIDGGKPGNIATGSNRQLTIQCLRNCDIRYPETLQDSETGKEKILVKVSIDASGGVTNAEIARSSGNKTLDRATVDGIKQMQLTPMGKPLTFRVKVSTLTNG
jgi:TonB family protein